LALAFFTAAGAAEPEEEAGLNFLDGRLTVHASGQGLYRHAQSDPARGIDSVDEFKARRILLGAIGRPVDGIEIGLAVEYNNFDPPVLEGDTARVELYEAWSEAGLPWTISIKGGRFLPPWTLTMPLADHELTFIRYPLLVDSGEMMFTPWQQTGLMVSARPGDNFFAAVGIFHGLDLPGALVDDNNMYDTMVTASLGLFPWMTFSAGHWGGKSELRSETLHHGESADLPFGMSTKNRGVLPIEAGGGVIEHNNTWIALELEYGAWYLATESIWNQADQDGHNLRDANGYQICVVYQKEWLTAMVRYEQLDPDSRDDLGGSDELEWTTLGAAARPFPWLRFTANYIFKSERGDNQFANEEFLLQATMSL